MFAIILDGLVLFGLGVLIPYVALCVIRLSAATHHTAPPNMRLKLTAPVLEGRIAFVNRAVWRRSVSAIP